MYLLKERIPHLTILLTAIILVFASSNINWGRQHWKNIIKADGKGYYAWLPAFFIYNDLHFDFFNQIEKEKYFSEELYYDYRVVVNNKTTNKYFVGTALLQAPFFLVAHFISNITHNDTDGYSKWYAVFINMAAIFYALAGLLFANQLLKTFSINSINRGIILLLFSFATNLFYYVVGEPAMSHIYSFACISAFLHYASKLKERKNAMYVLSILLALIVLVRPINIIIVGILPFFFSGFKDFFITILSPIKRIFLSVIIFIVITSIQPLLYFYQTGIFFPDTYPAEHFNFSNPHIISFLFSFKKGLFLYSPILLISLIGVYLLFHQNKFRGVYILLFISVLIYVLSSWWNWWYGGSFSARVILDYLSVFMLFFSVTLEKSKKSLRYPLIAFSAFCLILCQIQTYQYRYYIIHWENMNLELYLKSIHSIFFS